MALFTTQRDISLFRHLNRELLWDIITQQCVYYKLQLEETKVNIYGEASGARFYNPPVILNALIWIIRLFPKYLGHKPLLLPTFLDLS